MKNSPSTKTEQGHTPPVQDIDGDTIAKFIETQQLKAKNAEKELSLRNKDLELKADYAKDLLNKQHDLLKNKP